MNRESNSEYYNKVHLWGRLTLLIAIILFLGIGVYLTFIRGFNPGFKVIFTAFLSVAAMVGHTWINLGDEIMYLLLMGPAATYMSQLTGNVKNMRLPAAMAACSMLDKNEPKLKRDILAAYGVAASVVTNTIFLLMLAVMGELMLNFLHPDVLELFNYVVPALFGSILAQFALKDIKVAIVSMLAVIVLVPVTAIPSSLKAIAVIILAVALNLLITKRKEEKETQG